MLVRLRTTFVLLRWCLSEAASCTQGETLNEDKALSQLIMALLKKHTVGSSRALLRTSCKVLYLVH